MTQNFFSPLLLQTLLALKLTCSQDLFHNGTDLDLGQALCDFSMCITVK